MGDKAHLRERIELVGAQWQQPLPDGLAAGELAAAVEIAFITHTDGHTYVALRPATLGKEPVLLFTASEWEAFTAGVKDGEFDHPW